MTPLIEHRLSVRFRDCDGLGHVNNAVYLTYLEQARFALWRAQLSYPAPGPAGAAKRGVGFILARAEVDFVAQARFGDELAVRIALGEIGRSSCRYEYEIADITTGRIAARAKTVQVWFDYDAEKPSPISDALRATLATPVHG